MNLHYSHSAPPWGRGGECSGGRGAAAPRVGVGVVKGIITPLLEIKKNVFQNYVQNSKTSLKNSSKKFPPQTLLAELLILFRDSAESAELL